ncbi:helix-turn-helix domain-containing protein [Sphingomonas sp. 3P27F8]|uniref:helix-turn-helix domain-containing protein n=1 Tax=Sphingomonas sp. 3P27F8 TaxID=2502213 RepID=UPI0010F46E6C|nr:helix-turn-helix domain-containing protein [Sphingomonas sp. 3P27F8]
MADITLDYVVPAEDLRPYVTLFYRFRADIPLFEDVERADHAQLRFRLSGREASYVFPDGSIQAVGEVHIVGPTSGAMRTRADGPLDVIGMGIQPAGWAALLGIDASTMLNRALDGEAFFGSAVRRVSDRMRAAHSTEDKVAVAAAFVRASIDRSDTGALTFARQIDAWLAGSPSPNVCELLEATGLSRRQVERRCNALYGGPPKLLARKYRALRAAVALANGTSTLDELISEGFYDQSHLIREIKQFAGLTPGQLRTEPNHLAQLTMSQRLALGGQVHSIISNT